VLALNFQPEPQELHVQPHQSILEHDGISNLHFDPKSNAGTSTHSTQREKINQHLSSIVGPEPSVDRRQLNGYYWRPQLETLLTTTGSTVSLEPVFASL
jgi:hypothetical protein